MTDTGYSMIRELLDHVATAARAIAAGTPDTPAGATLADITSFSNECARKNGPDDAKEIPAPHYVQTALAMVSKLKLNSLQYRGPGGRSASVMMLKALGIPKPDDSLGDLIGLIAYDPMRTPSETVYAKIRRAVAELFAIYLAYEYMKANSWKALSHHDYGLLIEAYALEPFYLNERSFESVAADIGTPMLVLEPVFRNGLPSFSIHPLEALIRL